MTTPNIEELIDRLRDPQTRGTTGEWFDRAVAADLLQSQAERIAMLEAVNKLLSGVQENTEEENRALRAQLAAIAATEPVAWFFTDIQSGDQEADTDPDSYTREVATGYKRKQPLFTRPMPADVTELVFYEFQWTNPGNQDNQPESMFVWARVEPRWNGTVQQKVDELLAYRYDDKPTYRVRALFTHPMPARPQDHEIRELVDRLTAIAKGYGQTQQLRERIAQEIRPFTFAKPAQDKSDNYLSEYCTGRTDLLKEQSSQPVAQPLSVDRITEVYKAAYPKYDIRSATVEVIAFVRLVEAAHGIEKARGFCRSA